jgi:hypothetical protein
MPTNPAVKPRPSAGLSLAICAALAAFLFIVVVLAETIPHGS